MKRFFVVVALTVSLAGCRDVIEPGPAAPPHPLFSTATTTATWTPIASMATERYALSAATGADGRIYVFGGQNFSTSESLGAEAYDPATDAWSSIADPGLLFLAGVARGGDGRIYLAGGTTDEFGTKRVLAYDPRSGTYETVAHMHHGRFGPAAATGPDGKVYVIGGLDPEVGPTNSAEVYDPDDDTWSLIASSRVAHYRAAALSGSDGRIYVFGGLGTFFSATAIVEAYDPVRDTWTDVASLPVSMSGHGGAAGTDGLLYVFGGATVTSRGYSARAFAYDPATDAWSTDVPSMGTIRFLPGAAAGLDGKIYAIGGFDGADGVTTAETLPTRPPNQAPTADPGDDQTAECVGGGADVTLDGSRSSDPDDGIALYEWLESSTVIATGVSPTLHFTMGSHTLTLRVTDHGGLSSTDEVLVTVRDTKAPTVNLSLLMDQVWPPNHSMVPVALGISAADGCDGSSTLSVTVTSNEPVNGLGDGNTASDWRVVDNGDGTFDVWVRAERSGMGNEREYIITATATDGAGNTRSITATVTVPNSHGGGVRAHPR